MVDNNGYLQVRSSKSRYGVWTNAVRVSIIWLVDCHLFPVDPYYECFVGMSASTRLRASSVHMYRHRN